MKSFLPGKATRSGAPAVDLESPASPRDVSVTLDKKQTATGKITKAGGSVSLTAADGSRFRLDVPANAVDSDMTVTMTAVKNIDGAPLDNQPTAVQLEPSGLFFKEMTTLTIVPAKEIPIKQQIIFGYEGDGKDYRLALVDHKSKEIKIRLMRFSGAGVGSGSDAAWAQNLMIQARTAADRIGNKIAQYAQEVRMQMWTEGEDSIDQEEVNERFNSLLDQLEDQVVRKAEVAAELDCKHARTAAELLLEVERQRELGLGRRPRLENFDARYAKLRKAFENCPGQYTVSGTSGPVTFSGQICSLDKPFVINGTFGNGSETQSFTPSSNTSGTVKETGNSGGCAQSGAGTYKITLNEAGSGFLEFSETVTGICGPFSSTKTYAFKLDLKPASGLSCP